MSGTWFITGINSGFGREMAEQLLEQGHRVAGTVRRKSSASALSGRFGNRLQLFEIDLADSKAIGAVVEAAFAAMGRIDVVVNNAGYGLFGPVEGLTQAQIEDQLDVNLLAPILLTQAALPFLRRQGGGRIIAISSYGGQATHPGASLYHASKWGLEGFFDSIAQEVAPLGIGVTIVEPGGARTGFRQAAGERVGADVGGYENTPVAMIRKVLSDPSRLPPGDPAKMVKAIIESVQMEPAPRRLALGSDAYQAIRKALTERLEALTVQKDKASSTDFTE